MYCITEHVNTISQSSVRMLVDVRRAFCQFISCCQRQDECIKMTSVRYFHQIPLFETCGGTKKTAKSSSTHKHIKSLREVSNFLALFDLFWESFQGVEICFRRLGNVQMWWFRGTWKVFHSLMLFMSPLASVSGGIILKYENFMNEKLLHHGVYLRKWPLTPYYFTMWRNYWAYDSHKIATIHLKTRLHI